MNANEAYFENGQVGGRARGPTTQPAAGAEDLPVSAEATFEEPAPKKEKRAPSQATQLVELAAQAELFHTPQGDAYALVDVDGHRETWPLKAKPFRRWLARRYFEARRGAPGAQAVQDALAVLEGQALYEGDTQAVHTRLAEHEGELYVDLADEHWQAVRIYADGWEIVADAPVRFRRTRGMDALPMPVAGGSIDELRPFVNVGSDAHWHLLVAFAVAALRPRGPYPILGLHGEQGSAKSTTARVLRSLVDPSTPALRATPREERDLMIAANNAWLVAFDNLSGIPQWLSDALSRLATGGGFGVRALYSDDDEILFDAQRPVILNGIEELATSSDLLDRLLILELPMIPDEERRDEADFWQAFEPLRPRLLGALLTAVATALERSPRVRLERLPRMADFAKWATAAEPALGWSDGAFMRSYAGNRAQAHELALETSPLSQPLLDLAGDGFEGTATELLAKLCELAGDELTRQKAWPKSGRGLSGRLTRLAPNLRALGVEIEREKETTGDRRRLITLRTKTDSTVPTVPTVPDGHARDGRDDRDANFPTSSNGGQLVVDEELNELDRLRAKHADIARSET